MPLLVCLPGRSSGGAGRRRRAFATTAALAVAVVAAGLALPTPGVSATRNIIAREYDLKAAFLFNFAQFVEWPADAFAETGSPITIGVLGLDPFGGRLDSLVAGERVGNRRLVVRRYRSVDEIDACQILFIAASEDDQLARINKTLGHRSILTVGETRDFTAHAGIIGLELSQRRVHLKINLGAATAARLTISSMLLRQAQIVASSED